MLSDSFQGKIQNLGVPVAVLFLGLVAYLGIREPRSLAFVFFGGLMAFVTRELGQRAVAHLMNADVNTHLSKNGSMLTLFTGFIAALFGYPLAILLPSENSYEMRAHEQWGQVVDVIWSKREFWLAVGGIMALTLISTLLFLLGQNTLAQIISVYTLSQMIPLREIIVKRSTDGAYILFHSGFMWLTFTGFNIMLLTVAVF